MSERGQINVPIACLCGLNILTSSETKAQNVLQTSNTGFILRNVNVKDNYAGY